MAEQPTIPINVVDKSLAEEDHSLIAIINEPNPVTGYEINKDQLRQLVQLPQYWITDENGRTINGMNYYKYFSNGSSGRLPIVIEKTITENGVYMAVDEHADGYNKVTVNTPVPPPAPVLIEKTVTENGTYLPTDDDADGYSKVTVDTYVPTYKTKTVAENGTYTASSDDADGYSKVTVDVPLNLDRTVRFIDYDGTLRYCYTPEEFAKLSSLPPLPTKWDYRYQRWNWTLEDAKAYVATYYSLTIGAVCESDNQYTKIYTILQQDTLSPVLQIQLGQAADGGATIVLVDWDDGTTSTMSGATGGYVSVQHTYSSGGNYTIRLKSTNNGAYVIATNKIYITGLLSDGTDNEYGPGRAYANAIYRIDGGRDLGAIGYNGLRNCSCLETINLPASVKRIGDCAFRNCYSLKSINIPDSITMMGNSIFQYCYSLQSISLPKTITTIESYNFQYCYSLKSIDIPDSVTSVGFDAFNGCYSLKSIKIPNTVTSIGNRIFYNCYSLQSIRLSSGITEIPQYMCYNCYSLRTPSVPTGVTKIGQYAFFNCTFKIISLPSTLTSVGNYAFGLNYGLTFLTNLPDNCKTIGNDAFNTCSSLVRFETRGLGAINERAFSNCQALTTVIISTYTTSINANAFNGCKNLRTIKFLSLTPALVANSNAWTGVPTTCKIYVPNSVLNTYKSATNYPDPSTYTYVGY